MVNCCRLREQGKFHLLCDRCEPRSRASILSFAQIANLKIRRWGKVLRPKATCTADGFFLQPPANVSVSWFVVGFLALINDSTYIKNKIYTYLESRHSHIRLFELSDKIKQTDM